MGSVLFQTVFTCEADECGRHAETEHTESVFQALDRSCPARKPSLPVGWTEIEGRVYCERHDVKVVAIVTTPATVRHRGIFFSGATEQIVVLRDLIQAADQAAGCADSGCCEANAPPVKDEELQAELEAFAVARKQAAEEREGWRRAREYRPGSCT